VKGFDGACTDFEGWTDNWNSECAIYYTAGYCADGGIVSTTKTKADMATWGTPPPYDACCVCGGGNTPAEHVGFQEASWWNPELWRDLDASTPRVACNPAKCSNPAACNIPNCTLVDHDEFYFGSSNNRYADTTICTTSSKQTGTASDDCVPSSMRKPWPSTVSLSDNEGSACRAAFGKPDLPTGCGQGGSDNCQMWFPAVVMPATRMAFCDTSVYVTGYLFTTPGREAFPQSESWPASAREWLHGKQVFSNVLSAGWTTSTRVYYAWPFTTWALADGTSTKNVGLFVYKRSLCKMNSSTGAYDCYSTQSSHCFTTTEDFAVASYPSTVGSSQLTTFANDLSKERCTPELEAKISPYTTAFVAAQ